MYFKKELVVKATRELQENTSNSFNKFFGLLSLFRLIDTSIVQPMRQYEINDKDIINWLDDTLTVVNIQPNTSTSTKKIRFSQKWDDYIHERISHNTSLQALLIFLYKYTHFEVEPTFEGLREKFKNEFHLSDDHLEMFFNQSQSQDFSFEFSDRSITREELKTELNISNSNKSIGFESQREFQKSAGQLTSAPFFQTLYAGLDFINCLMISNEDIESNYPSHSNKPINPSDDMAQQIIYYGAPGTGKSFAIETATEGEDVIRTTFHPDSDYSTFVGAYKPTTVDEQLMTVIGTKAVPVENPDGSPRTEKRIVYEFVNQAFLQAYVGAWEKLADNTIEPKKQYLVIEEINRGNCAQIFGDLFQLLDRNPQGFSEYPIKADADMKKQLKKQLAGLTIENADAINALYKNEDVVGKVQDGDILLLPSNLFIWATMNTSDQSLFPIDSAFKRRWDWKYVPIANAGKGWRIQINGKQYDWWDFLKKINALIGEKTHSEDKKLGYFFCKTETGIIDAETFVGKVIFYLWNDVFKDFEFEGDVFDDTDDTENNKLTFDKFYKPDATIQESKVEVFLNNLGVILVDETEEEEFIPNEEDEDISDPGVSESASDGKDRSRYSINGQGSFNKRKLALECVRIYSNNHPNLTAQELVDVWMGLNLMRTNFIETSAFHAERAEAAKNDSIFDKRYYPHSLPNNNGTVYINNQFDVERINDFVKKVNAQDWGIHIEKN